MRETSTATLLFCDLVGSTELFSRVGDDAADALRRTIFGALRAALDECGGIEVKHLGDGLMAVFTASATDAIASAVSMQRRISEMDASSTVGPIELRVGLSTGEVAPEDGDWFGRPVIEAARLCAAAAPRVILTSDVVRSVAGTRGGYQFTSAGLLNLKGLGAPVGAWAVEWHADGAAASGRLVVPAASSHGVPTALDRGSGPSCSSAPLVGMARGAATEPRLDHQPDRAGAEWLHASPAERRL